MIGQRQRIRVGIFCAVALAASGLANQAGATVFVWTGNGQETIPMDSLAGTSNSILVGDKMFSNFAYSATGDMPGASMVNVSPEIVTQNGQTLWGIEIQGNFLDTTSTVNGSDAKIKYTVTVVDPTAFLISDAHLSGFSTVIGSGSVVVTEGWTPDTGDPLLEIYTVQPGDLTQFDAPAAIFDVPVASIDVSKDISADVTSTSGVAMISTIDQLYSQVPVGGNTPEPASLGFLGLGVIGLAARRRK